jgi:hypothetical protein
MRIIIAAILAVALAGCVTTTSPSQAIHTYPSVRPAAEVRSCVEGVFSPRFYGGVAVQGGWPEIPVDMKIGDTDTGTRITTRGPMDPRFAACL